MQQELFTKAADIHCITVTVLRADGVGGQMTNLLVSLPPSYPITRGGRQWRANGMVCGLQEMRACQKRRGKIKP